HPEETGYHGGDGDDGGPTPHLLDDLVLAVVAQAEVGLGQGAHQVAERVGRLSYSHQVVIHVQEIGKEWFGYHVPLPSEKPTDRLAGWHHQPVEPGHDPAHLEPVALLAQIERLLGEDTLADAVVVLVEGL